MPDAELYMQVASLTAPDAPMTPEQAATSPVYVDLSTPKVRPGDPAPDFTLRQQNGPLVTLSHHRGKRPVALIFGSYT
jgi:hypothetical protein